MSFREKSAWIMGAVTAFTGLLYAWISRHPGEPAITTFIPYVVAVVVLSVAAQVILAIALPREARAPADERERIVIHKAGHWSGWVMAAGVVIAALMFLGDQRDVAGTVLFQRVILALILGQVVDYALQVYFLRRAI